MVTNPPAVRPGQPAGGPALTQVRVEERQAAVPQRFRRISVVHLWSGVVEEGVVGARVDDDLDVLAQCPELFPESFGRAGAK